VQEVQMSEQVIVAVDPAKRVHAVNVVTVRSEVLARRTFANSSDGFRELLKFGRKWRDREWAVEGSRGTGKNLAQRLVSQGESVIDVPSRKSSLVRAFASDSGRKTDDVDAFSIGLAAWHSPDLERVRTDDHTETLRLLTQRRKELVSLRTQALGRLHRELLILLPGGAKRRLTVAMTKQLLASVRPRDEVGKVRKQLAVDQLADLVAIDKRIADINRQIKAAVAKVDTSLGDIFGVGPIVTAMILGEVRNVARFRNADHFASYNATAPGLWGSGGDATPCVNLRGNRTLNCAVHIVALSQMRHTGLGRDYYLRKIAGGKTKRAALRCLKRRISNVVYRHLVADAVRQAGSPGGQLGATLQSSAADQIPTANTSEQPQPGLAENATPKLLAAS
jgi:transposase